MAGDESGRKYMTVSLTKAVRMDLCPSCLAVFERLKETLEKLEHQDMQSHAKKRQEIIEGFWREIRAKQETAGAAHERP